MTAPQYATLHSAHMSLIIEIVPDGAPLWRYWGPRLSDDCLPPMPLREERPTPTFSLDAPVAFSLLPTFGCGWFGQSALLAHRAGQDFAQDFTQSALIWRVPGQALRVELVDAVAAIQVMLDIALDGEALTLSSRLTNSGTSPLELQWLAACTLPLPQQARTVHSYTGRHNHEFVAQCDPLGRAMWRKENRRGLTSHDAFPGALIDSGDIWYGAQLGWSGNHAQTIEWLDDGRYQWQLGEWFAPGEMRLLPGESYASPPVLATCSAAGQGGVARNFHRAVRALIDWPERPMRPRPVHLNTWEGYYFDHDLPSLLRLADVAAEVGIERFVLDDGWFHRRDDDRRGLGDWWADARKYPGGLAPLAQHVTAKGMAFGLWVEPEMVNPDSALFRAHPDWALHIAGRPMLTARNQLVLDLGRAEVAEYLFDALAKLLNDLPISYLKWDHNRDLAPAGGRDGRASYHRQVQGAYGLFDRIRAAFPAVEIEACAGGGGRIDAGIIRRTHRFWTSDCIDAVSRVAMQAGFLQFMPPEVMGAHIGASPAHSTGRSQSLDFRTAVALQGHLGVECDLVQMAETERQRLAQWIAFYQRWRGLLHAELWQGEAEDSLHWHAAGNDREWLLIVYRLAPTSWRHAPPLQLPFVRGDQAYSIAAIAPEGTGAPTRYHGDWLRAAGLTLPPMLAESALLFHICESA